MEAQVEAAGGHGAGRLGRRHRGPSRSSRSGSPISRSRSRRQRDGPALTTVTEAWAPSTATEAEQAAGRTVMDPQAAARRPRSASWRVCARGSRRSETGWDQFGGRRALHQPAGRENRILSSSRAVQDRPGKAFDRPRPRSSVQAVDDKVEPPRPRSVGSAGRGRAPHQRRRGTRSTNQDAQGAVVVRRRAYVTAATWPPRVSSIDQEHERPYVRSDLQRGGDGILGSDRRQRRRRLAIVLGRQQSTPPRDSERIRRARQDHRTGLPPRGPPTWPALLGRASCRRSRCFEERRGARPSARRLVSARASSDPGPTVRCSSHDGYYPSPA